MRADRLFACGKMLLQALAAILRFDRVLRDAPDKLDRVNGRAVCWAAPSSSTKKCGAISRMIFDETVGDI